jgi:hypothetical protein
MPYIYTITSDERLLTNFYGFDKASKDAFEGDDKHRFEAILIAHEFRKQLIGRLIELRGSTKPTFIDPKIIDNKDNDQTIIERLAAMLLDKPSLRNFIKQNQNKISKEISSLLKDVVQGVQDNEYVMFWLVSEDELDEIL